RHVSVVHGHRLVAKQRAGKPHRLRGRDWGQVDPIGDVADGVNRVYRALGVFIHHYRAVGGQFHTRGLQAQVPGARLASGREHHQAVVLDAVTAEQDLDLRAELHQAHGVQVEPHVDPLAGHLLAEALADLGVEAAQQPVAAVRERSGYPYAVEDRGELHRDVAAADYQSARWQILEMEGFVRRDGEPAAGDLRQARPGAGRHEDVTSAIGAAEPVGLGDRHARAVDVGQAARADTARTTADGEKIEIEAQLTSDSGG